MSVENALLNKLLGVKDEGEVPVILVKRVLPHPLTSKMHETGWVGLRRVMRKGKPALEKDFNFKLSINEKGVAEIPDCEENRERLERLCKPRTKKVPVFVKNGNGKRVKKKDAKGNTVYETTEIPPLYQRLDVSVLSDNLLDALLDRMKARANARTEEDFEPEEPEAPVETPVRGRRPGLRSSQENAGDGE